MNHQFSDLEALRIAMEMERKGEQFYRSSLGLVHNPEAKDLIEQLRLQEKHHMEKFAMLYKRALSMQEDDGESAIFDQEGNAYMSAVAADIVFPGGMMARLLHQKIETMNDLLMISILSEKDSILFYNEVCEKTNSLAYRTVFHEIIQEEKRHLVELQNLLESTVDMAL